MHKCDSICAQYGCDGGNVVDRIDDTPILHAQPGGWMCRAIPIRDTQGEQNWEREAAEAKIDQTELWHILND